MKACDVRRATCDEGEGVTSHLAPCTLHGSAATWKRCSQCGVNRPLSEFVVSRRAKSGYEPRCKACRNTYENAWRRAGGAERLKAREKQRRDEEWQRIRAAVLGG